MENKVTADYVDEEGCLHCGICGKRKQMKVSLMGFEHVVSCLCECEVKARQELDEKMQREEAQRLLYQRKSVGLRERRFWEWKFENDNGSNQKILIARQYVENWTDMKRKNVGLLLMGPVGTGKSFFAGCIANALLEQGERVMMTNFSRILNEMTSYQANKNQIIQNLVDYPLLIIDDLGIERNSEFALEQVYNVIDSRYCKMLPLIVTTNLGLNEMKSTDPEAEYYPLVQALHGQVIRISPVSDQYINPMDLNLNYSEEDNPLSLKADFILSLCELIVGGKNGLEPVEKTIIDRCVRLVYQEYLADPVPEKMPILEDLYNLLRKQEEPEAQRLATSLEIYVTGSLNVFNHRTNVDINNRIVCFDIKELGKQLKKIGMLIVQDQVWNRVTINRSAHKSTRYYVDEFHLLLKEEQTAAYSVEIWKRFRKWGGIPTGITQNIKDLLASREIENIFENSDFIYMLNQASGDRQILAKQLNISPTQLSYVTNSNEGEGLLFYGNVIIPFVDRFPKNSLYKIMTTRPEETAEAG